VRQTRVRRSGAASFIDVTIAVSRRAHFEQAHTVAESVASAVRSVVPRSDVVVHVDPLTEVDETLADVVAAAASARGVRAHGLRLHAVGDSFSLELHVEVPANLSLGEAHRLVTEFESAVKSEVSWLGDVKSHIEPLEEVRASVPEGSETAEIRSRVEAVARSRKLDVHNVEAFLADDEWHVSLHFLVPPETSVVEAHRASEQLEKNLRETIPNLGRIVLHAEPPGDGIGSSAGGP
jgi:divalent metal cation (Fe/Co/Zn/Cd) transporter